MQRSGSGAGQQSSVRASCSKVQTAGRRQDRQLDQGVAPANRRATAARADSTQNATGSQHPPLSMLQMTKLRLVARTSLYLPARLAHCCCTPSMACAAGEGSGSGGGAQIGRAHV